MCLYNNNNNNNNSNNNNKIWLKSTDYKGSQTDLDAPGWTSWSVLLNVSYHKEYDYLWFRGGDLNGFRDIKTFMKLMGGKYPGTAQEDFPFNVIEYIF